MPVWIHPTATCHSADLSRMRLVADRGAQQAAEYLLRAAPALRRVEHVARDRHVDAVVPREGDDGRGADRVEGEVAPGLQPDLRADEIGRASCRERVCQYVCISVVAVSLKKKKKSEKQKK